MLHLAKHTYKVLGERRSEVLSIIVHSSPPKSRFAVVWQPVLNGDSSKQVYFWPEEPSKPETAESGKHCEMSTEKVGGGITSSSTDSSALDSKTHQTVLRQLGMLLTDAPRWIWEHFKSINIVIPEAEPLSVFDYYSKHSSKVLQNVPCKIKDSVFEDEDSFKCFIKFVTNDYYSHT